MAELWKGTAMSEGSGLAPTQTGELQHPPPLGWKNLPGLPISRILRVPTKEPFPAGKWEEKNGSEGSWAIPSLFPAIPSLPGAVPKSESTVASCQWDSNMEQ